MVTLNLESFLLWLQNGIWLHCFSWLKRVLAYMRWSYILMRFAFHASLMTHKRFMILHTYQKFLYDRRYTNPYPHGSLVLLGTRLDLSAYERSPCLTSTLQLRFTPWHTTDSQDWHSHTQACFFFHRTTHIVHVIRLKPCAPVQAAGS